MIKLFKKTDQTFTPNNGGAVLGLVNTAFSDNLGAGIGTFEDCAIEWTVTYDEVLFVLDGILTIRVGDDAFSAGPGDVLWIPKDTALVYEATVDGKALTFRMEGDGVGPLAILVDDQTGSTWLAFTGRAVDGELKGTTVDRVTSHLSFWFAWSDWNPDTKLHLG